MFRVKLHLTCMNKEIEVGFAYVLKKVTGKLISGREFKSSTFSFERVMNMITIIYF